MGGIGAYVCTLVVIANVVVVRGEVTAAERFESVSKKLMLWMANVKIPDEISFGTRTPLERCNKTLISDNGHMYSHHAMLALTKMKAFNLDELLSKTLDETNYYQPNLDCLMRIEDAALDVHYLVQFISDIDLSSGLRQSNASLPPSTSPSDECRDYLEIGFMQVLQFYRVALFCDNFYDVEDLTPVVIPANNVIFHFHTSNYSESLGFSIQFSIFRPHVNSAPCNSNEFSCDESPVKVDKATADSDTVHLRRRDDQMNASDVAGRCVSMVFRCDKLHHCVDKSDESKKIAGCRAKHMWAGSVTSLGVYGMLAVLIILSIVVVVAIGCVIRAVRCK